MAEVEMTQLSPKVVSKNSMIQKQDENGKEARDETEGKFGKVHWGRQKMRSKYIYYCDALAVHNKMLRTHESVVQ